MITETKKSLSDYYDHMKQSNATCGDTKTPIYKKFVIEYCDDQRKLDRLGYLPEYGGLELDDVYHSITYTEEPKEYGFNTFEGIVWEQYLHLYFNPKICDVKMWEEIWQGDEILEERWLQFPSTFAHSLAKILEKDLISERDTQKARADALAKENDLMRQFIEKFHATETFREFKEGVSA